MINVEVFIEHLADINKRRRCLLNMLLESFGIVFRNFVQLVRCRFKDGVEIYSYQAFEFRVNTPDDYKLIETINYLDPDNLISLFAVCLVDLSKTTKLVTNL